MPNNSDTTDTPPHYKLIYDKASVASGVAKTAASITDWIGLQADTLQSDDSQQVLAICILRGGTFFFADLLREIPRSVEAAYCSAKSYSIETNETSGELTFSIDNINAKGRRVLLVDEICDSGLTFERLIKAFSDAGALEVRTAALIDRKLETKEYVPDWSVFDHKGHEWFVGLGMDDKNTYTNLPDIYVVES